MFRKIYGLVSFAVAAVLAGCGSPITVNTDYDADVDFAKYETYGWLDSSDSPRIPDGNQLLEARIVQAVESELQARGMTKSADAPDVLVNFQGSRDQELQVTDWGYSYAGSRWGHGGRDIDVRNVSKGTLIIDLIDVADNHLVWRAVGQKTLGSQPSTPEEATKRINEAIHEIMKRYPPGS